MRNQLAWLRRLVGLLGWLLLLVGLAVVVIASRHGVDLLRAFSGDNLRELLTLLGTLVLLLIPISGTYSVASQYAFWSGWLGGLPQRPEPLPITAHDADTVAIESAVIYLDGIHQSERDHPPRVRAFLTELEASLPSGIALLKGLEAYTVTPASLWEDAGGSWFWRRVFALQEHHPNAVVGFVCAFLVQANNVIKVGISSDRRYGPILNYALALKVCQRLVEAQLWPDPVSARGPRELILLGYSGGGEMAMGMADYLRRLCRCPVRIITFCGVFSGNQLLEQVAQITQVVGSKDAVAAFGRLAYPGRLALLPLSNWNRARRRGQIERISITGMNHNGQRGPFSERYRPAVVQAIVNTLAAAEASPS
ncbi:MAG: alpha/beta hydrolase [Cyanobacteria bacterium K_DeepCast_35m_m2_023]|nr:alpha/beta hydrolase [Cyanobacteria bacterium K_DeepCast_35m_m2_023]